MSNRESRCRHRARAPQALFACPTVSIRKFNSRNSSVARDEVGIERKFLQFPLAGGRGGGAKATDLKNLFSPTCRWRRGSILPASRRRPFSSRVKNRHRKILRGSPRRPGLLATTTTTTTWIRNIYDVSVFAVNIWTHRVYLTKLSRSSSFVHHGPFSFW